MGPLLGRDAPGLGPLVLYVEVSMPLEAPEFLEADLAYRAEVREHAVDRAEVTVDAHEIPLAVGGGDLIGGGWIGVVTGKDIQIGTVHEERYLQRFLDRVPILPVVFSAAVAEPLVLAVAARILDGRILAPDVSPAL